MKWTYFHAMSRDMLALHGFFVWPRTLPAQAAASTPAAAASIGPRHAPKNPAPAPVAQPQPQAEVCTCEP
jgi:hypothetical protein